MLSYLVHLQCIHWRILCFGLGAQSFSFFQSRGEGLSQSLWKKHGQDPDDESQNSHNELQNQRENRSYCSTAHSRKCTFMLYHASVLESYTIEHKQVFDCGYIPEADRSRCQRGKRRKEPLHFPPDTSCYHCRQPETCRTSVCY